MRIRPARRRSRLLFPVAQRLEPRVVPSTFRGQSLGLVDLAGPTPGVGPDGVADVRLDLTGLDPTRVPVGAVIRGD